MNRLFGQKVASTGLRDTGAVASARAAKIYGLDILAEKIQVRLPSLQICKTRAYKSNKQLITLDQSSKALSSLITKHLHLTL